MSLENHYLLRGLRFHKSTDSIDRHKKKYEDKWEAFRICEILINKQYFGGNKRFYLTYDCDNEKILGNYSSTMISEAIDEYIALHHTKLIKPLLNQITIFLANNLVQLGNNY